MTATHIHRKELILITDISPDLNGSDSQHLKDIIKCLNVYSRLRIVHVNTNSIDYHRIRSPASDRSILQSSASEVRLVAPTKFENTLLSDSDQTAYLHRIRNNAFEFFEECRQELRGAWERSVIVIFVQWPGMIFFWEACALSKCGTVPILMDGYELLFIAYPLAKSSQALIADSFEVALGCSTGLLTGSKRAAQGLTKSLQIPCREIMSVFRDAHAPGQTPRDTGLSKLRQLEHSKKRSIEIALAGQIYAIDSTELFLDALARLNSVASGDGRTYVLNYYGDAQIRDLYSHTCIAVHGSLKYSELNKVMAESCVFGLVPYSFNVSFAAAAAFSFPSKLVAYIQAGVIPIYVGPRNSSVFDLLYEYRLSELCITTESPALIAEQLVKIVNGDLLALQKKLLTLADVFEPDYLQSCISDVLDRIS